MRISNWLFLLLCPLLVCAADLEQGKAVFRGNCAFCHGVDGRGGRGPDLTTARRVHGSSDAAVRDVIVKGVPGTTMPSFRLEDDEMESLLAFVHQFGANASTAAPPGDPAKGQAVYRRSGCAGCHRIGNQGSVFAPDLTRIGASRSLEYLRTSIVKPSADVPPEYEAVSVVTRDGKSISGLRVNEDTFSIQLRDQNQRFRMFRKSELRDVKYPKESLMPPYASLSNDDMDNLLAYLDGLRGAVSGDTKQAEGIR